MCGFESRVEFVPGPSKIFGPESVLPRRDLRQSAWQSKTGAENHVIVVRQRIGESVPSTEAAERSAPVHHG